MSNENKLSATFKNEVGRSIYVIQLNKFEWWAAEDIKSALNAASITEGIPIYEIIDELCPPRILNYEECMERILNNGVHEVPFAIELSRRVFENEDFPQPFAKIG
jgi:hypothetical protein